MERPLLVPAQRVWLAFIQLALLLPFATVQDCSTHETHTFTGLEVYFAPERGAVILPVLVALLLLIALPWAGKRTQAEAVNVGLRAWLAGVATMVAAFGPMIFFLFDSVDPLIGWILHVAGWALTFLGLFGLAVVLLARPDDTPAPGGPGPWSRAELAGVGLLAVTPPFTFALSAVMRPDEITGVLAGLGVGLLSVVPLIVTGLALARAIGGKWPMTGQRILWWLATVATVAAHVSALVDG